MPVQVTLGFATDLGNGGAWDEVYYTSHTNPSDAAEAWNATLGLIGLSSTSVLGRRLGALSDQCYMYYARFSHVDTKPRLKAILQRGRVDGYRASENFAADAASFQIFSQGQTVKRNVRLGGLPDNVVSDNVIDKSFINSYILGRNGFLQAWAQNQGVIRYRTETLGGDFSYTIAGVAKADQTAPLVVTINRNGTPWALGSYVDLSTRGNPQVRGRWQIAATNNTGSVITLRGSEKVSCPPLLVGLVTPYTPQVTPFIAGTPSASLNAGIVILAAHKLGKKKLGPRGRRSAVLIRH